jgi:hypothetical protein
MAVTCSGVTTAAINVVAMPCDCGFNFSAVVEVPLDRDLGVAVLEGSATAVTNSASDFMLIWIFIHQNHSELILLLRSSAARKKFAS